MGRSLPAGAPKEKKTHVAEDRMGRDENPRVADSWKHCTKMEREDGAALLPSLSVTDTVGFALNFGTFKTYFGTVKFLQFPG